MRTNLACAFRIALVLAVLGSLAPASVATAQVAGLDFQRQSGPQILLDPPCAPEAEQCQVVINGRLTAALLYLGEVRSSEARALAALAADANSVLVRVAAAQALGSLLPDAGDTPVLAELLDDPVPSVRAAALAALSSSSDERGRLFAQRADRFGLAKAAEGAEDAPEVWPAVAAMGIPMPANPLFLHFGSDPARGRFAWVTSESAAKVLALYRGKGKGPFTIEEYDRFLEREDEEASARQNEMADSLEVEDGEMPSAEQLAKAMEMATKAMQAMDDSAGKSAEEQAEAFSQALGGARRRDHNLTNLYQQAELFGDVRFVLVEVDKTTEIVVAVYRDLVLGTTGVGVHRRPL